ncbi:hypothetical protein HDU86_007777 [Geranomyces michiganensis]|nr:hypothetical protein HDU86_007777 [Geranomyces michiganensis]
MNKQDSWVHTAQSYHTWAARTKGNSMSNLEDPNEAYPTYLSLINGTPVIQHVVENLNVEANFIFIVPQADYDRYQLKYMLSVLRPNCNIIVADGRTAGPAASILLAKPLIDDDTPLLIANCTQLLKWDSNAFLYAMDHTQVAGGIVTFKSDDPRYSYVKVTPDNWVAEIHEKKVISDIATAGVYYWKHGKDFVRFASELVKDPANLVGQAFYVSGAYARAIAEGLAIRPIPCKSYVPLGNAEDVNGYINVESTLSVTMANSLAAREKRPDSGVTLDMPSTAENS